MGRHAVFVCDVHDDLTRHRLRERVYPRVAIGDDGQQTTLHLNGLLTEDAGKHVNDRLRRNPASLSQILPCYLSRNSVRMRLGLNELKPVKGELRRRLLGFLDIRAFKSFGRRLKANLVDCSRRSL